MGKPALIAIDHDDYHANHVGRTRDGKQFFLTTPFVPAHQGQPRREFIALYLFDDDGKLLEARIDDLGPRADLDRNNAARIFEQRLQEISPVQFGRIEVQPFEIERFGVVFGFIPRDSEGDEWWVELQPGNYMAFHEPWDSGEYDT